MTRRALAAEPPLRLSRSFERHRLEPQLWSQVYAHLVPSPGRPPARDGGAAAGKKKPEASSAVDASSLGGICA
jgi:hypothetical protein